MMLTGPVIFDRVYKQTVDANTSHVLHKFSFVPSDYSTVT